MATALTVDEANQLLRDGTPLNGNAFPIMGTIARLAVDRESETDARDLLIRVLDRREDLSAGEQELLDSLVVRTGLYPYAAPERLSTAEQIAFEYHKPEPLEAEEFVFHSMQREVYERLINGQSLLLSAPTSFGKSVITDALVASEKWNTIAIVVPTLALIDETRRRLARFSERYKINTFPNQERDVRTLFIMTQERLLEVEPFPEFDLFIIDEFYKLDSDTDPERAGLLNIAWDRLRRTGAQFYLTGPNISNLSESLPEALRESLVVTDFRTVAVDLVTVPQQPTERERVLSVCEGVDGQTLIYCRTPARVREIGRWLLEAQRGAVSSATSPQSATGLVAASWVAENYDPEWTAGRCLAAGIGLHHARIPRALQHHTVRLFNAGALKYLICTSTLIEGVNTAAENVLVVDSILNRRALDYFTFSNIRGRAGRMFRHFVGKVYLFAGSPQPEQTTIDIPIASQSPRASAATLIQLPDDELSDATRARIEPYVNQDDLELETMKANRGLDPERQLTLARTLRSNARYWSQQLAWSGYPTFDQTVAVSRLMLDHLVPSQQKGRVTDRSLAARLNAVGRSEGSIPRLVVRTGSLQPLAR